MAYSRQASKERYDHTARRDEARERVEARVERALERASRGPSAPSRFAYVYGADVDALFAEYINV